MNLLDKILVNRTYLNLPIKFSKIFNCASYIVFGRFWYFVYFALKRFFWLIEVEVLIKMRLGLQRTQVRQKF